MAQSYNQVTLIGRVGKDPEVRTFQSGDKIATFSLATAESWKDKTTGEKKERTEWHNISITNQGLVKVVDNYVKKGSLLLVVGQLETRSWEKDGQKRYATEVVLRPFRGELTMLDSRSEVDRPAQKTERVALNDDPSDEIPF